MRNVVRGGIGLSLIALGYLLGSLGVLGPAPAQAQPEQEELTKDTKEKLRVANEALVAAMEGLRAENRYVPATEGMNTFAIVCGGVDAMNDLETGRGVDPETFAALYADLAIPEIRADLARDNEGRLTYKNKVVRMYPIARLKQLFTERDRIAGIEQKKPATP